MFSDEIPVPSSGVGFSPFMETVHNFKDLDEYGRREALRQRFCKVDFDYIERCAVHFERGDWQMFDKQSPRDPGAEVTPKGRLIRSAIATGYRLIDTAASYFNERQVGEGMRRTGISRDDMFIETKVWISDYGYDPTLHAFDKSAGKLGVERVDLLLLHQPLPSRFDLTLDAYRALEKLLRDGEVRAIGVSNFMPEHLTRLLAEVTVVPAVNQIELHPYFQQTELQRLHARHTDAGVVADRWDLLVPRRREAHL